MNETVSKWCDTSPDASAIAFIKSNKMTRIFFTKKFAFSQEATTRTNFNREIFFLLHSKDYYVDKSIKETIEGFKQYVTVYSGNRPLFANSSLYKLLCIIMLGWL